MLDIPLVRESSLVLAMKLLQNLLDEDGDTVLETDVFYWNNVGNDEAMPNFWLKETNFQMEWYNDDPGRGAFSNFDSNAELAFFITDRVRESYAAVTRGKKKKS